jgi:hypothetical protein
MRKLEKKKKFHNVALITICLYDNNVKEETFITNWLSPLERIIKYKRP